MIITKQITGGRDSDPGDVGHERVQDSDRAVAAGVAALLPMICCAII